MRHLLSLGLETRATSETGGRREGQLERMALGWAGRDKVEEMRLVRGKRGVREGGGGAGGGTVGEDGVGLGGARQSRGNEVS